MPHVNTKIASLRDSVRRLARGGIKCASLGNDQDQPFEQAFSSLASAYIADKAPSLLDYQIGFQMLARNQESTKAVGVHGFKVGPQWLYAPVFFLNGDLKGHELLYIQGQDLFVPLKENWLNYLLNRKPSVLGTSVSKNMSRLGVISPSLTQISRPPNKYASAPVLTKWATEMLPLYAEWVTAIPEAPAMDVAAFLRKEGSTVIKSLIAGFAANPQFAQTFEQFYGMDVIDEAIKEAKAREAATVSTSVIKASACVMTPHGPRCVRDKSKLRPDNKSVLAKPAPTETNAEPGDLLKGAYGEPYDDAITYALQRTVRVYTYDDIARHGTGMEGLDDKERSKLLKDKILIKDDRSDRDTVDAYEVQTALRLQTPTETGLYDVVTKSNELTKCLVILGPHANDRRAEFATVVALEGGKSGRSWVNTHASNVWTANHYSRQDFYDWVDEQRKVDSLSPSRTGLYVLISKLGEGTLPFRVRSEISEGSRCCYDVSFKSHSSKPRADHLPKWRPDYDNPGISYCCAERLVLTGNAGAKMRATGEELYVPADFRLVELKPDRDNDGAFFCCDDSSDPPPIEPGSQIDINLLMGSKTATVKIYDGGGSEIDVNGRRMQKLAALVHLVRDWQLREKTARLLLKRAAEKKTARFRILKSAEQIHDLQRNAPSAPGFPEPTAGFDPFTGGQVPTQHASEWALPVTDMSSSRSDPSLQRPNEGPEPRYAQGNQPGPDRDAQNLAIQAGQMGQKDVFDTAVLGGLLKITRDDSMIDRNIPDMTKGMDRFGRTLFLFYWHNEKFADRYGKDEMIELEDGLRNAFEYAGDIVLFLKQRSIEPDFHENSDINLSAVSN